MKKPENLARILLFALLAAAGFAGALAAAPALGLAARDASDYTLHARMPENGGWSLDTLHAEVGKPLRLRLTSDDVLHSFAVGLMSTPPIDLKPGEWSETTLVFDRPGKYTYYCTRWCGRNHWRMRGTIIVDGPGTPIDEASAQPLYLRLGLDLDAPHVAGDVPAAPPSAARGAAAAARLGSTLSAWALDRQTYLENSPAALFQKLSAEPGLQSLPAAERWDLAAYLYARQTSPAALAEAQALYATNCAACHGETGQGDGVMVEGLPRYQPSAAHVSPTAATGSAAMGGMTEMGLSAPPDLSNPRTALGASPALLEGKMLRGGMGTGMPYWGPIFTPAQMDGLIAYLYTFAWK